MMAAFAASLSRDCPALPVSVRVLASGMEDRLQQDDLWETLLARANDGDGAAFARFLHIVTPTLRAVIRRRSGGLPPDQHEDILQEVLLAIHLKRQTWRRDAPVRPWLYALTRYKVVDAFRKRGATVTLPIEEFADVLPEENAAVPLTDRDTEVMLGLIDARSAGLVRAVALDGKSAEEAGASLGLSAGATRVVLHRAMRRLSVFAERMMK
jgi:RNA polymerase sigma factor (sigma-70 family)